MRSWLSVAFVLAAAISVSSVAGQGWARKLLPPSNAVPGWARKAAPRTYLPENLYRHIDGAADLYLSYGLREAAVVDFYRGRREWISVDVYDMGAPLHAFGIFGSEKPPQTKDLGIGAQSYAEGELVAFWKGRHYVKVALLEGKDAGSAVALARATAMYLPGTAEMPVEVGRLPRAGRVARSERYVKKGALGHKFLVEVVSADYKVGHVTASLHIADPGAPLRARAGLQKLRDFEKSVGEEMAEAAALGKGAFAVRDPSLGELVAKQEGRFLVIAVSEKADRGSLVSLAKAVALIKDGPVRDRARRGAKQ